MCLAFLISERLKVKNLRSLPKDSKMSQKRLYSHDVLQIIKPLDAGFISLHLQNNSRGDGFNTFILEMEKGLDESEGISPDSHLWKVDGLRTLRSETGTFTTRGQPEAGPLLRHQLCGPENICPGHPSLPHLRLGLGKAV